MPKNKDPFKYRILKSRNMKNLFSFTFNTSKKISRQVKICKQDKMSRDGEGGFFPFSKTPPIYNTAYSPRTPTPKVLRSLTKLRYKFQAKSVQVKKCMKVDFSKGTGRFID